ncbi:MAG: hypothetical protein ACREOW_16770 [Thermodesulfobacteriota bacterium]
MRNVKLMPIGVFLVLASLVFISPAQGASIPQRVAALESVVAALQVQVAAQQTTINSLQAKDTALMNDLATAQTTIANLQSDLATAEITIAALQTDLDTAESTIVALEAKDMTLMTDLSTSQSDIDSVQSDLAGAQSALDLATQLGDCMSVNMNTINGLIGPHVIFSGCNVHVRNGGIGQTNTVNGRGNIIIGYNEDTFPPGPNNRTGSHNLIIGPEHTYSSFGGFVAGAANTISNQVTSVSGGQGNTASGIASSVSGGLGNTASGNFSSVSGGGDNTAGGLASSVSGGFQRSAPNSDDWAAGALFQDF